MRQPNPHMKIELVPILELVHKIDLGILRVPAFQREFVWNDKKIQELFSSIYDGFPIGSILLWTTDNRNYKAKLDNSTPFPAKQISYPITFVIDGVQRLSSLYGGLYNKLTEFFPKKPTLVFDLSKKGFQTADDITPRYFQLVSKTKNKPYFELSALLSSDDFIDAQEKLFEQGKKEYVKVLLELFDRFNDYKIPVVEITNKDISEVVDIFLKLNKNVQKLANDELQEAQNWLIRHT